jgi:hypothetical protein
VVIQISTTNSVGGHHARAISGPSATMLNRIGGATLLDVVNFYNKRFNLNFTDQQKEDLVNFLNTL